MTGTTHSTEGHERSYLPPMGTEWLLPLYDPLTRLFGVRAIHRRLLGQAGLRGGQEVLEIGCGTGNLLLEAKALEPGAEVTGLDPDLAALARARRKSRRRRLPVRLAHGYADELPCPDDSVDVVLSAFMLHHLPETEKEPAAREVLRVLRPGGALHLVDIGGHADPADGRATRIASADERMRGNFGEGIPALLRRAGFDDVAEAGSLVRRRTGRITFYRATASG